MFQANGVRVTFSGNVYQQVTIRRHIFQLGNRRGEFQILLNELSHSCTEVVADESPFSQLFSNG